MRKNLMVIITGAVVGIAALLLQQLGNPANMGFCIACFVRDISGSIHLHKSAVTQYFRPEIVGLVLGSFIISLFRKEFRPRGGSSPFTRLIIGAAVMTGALMFLGCPLRMLIRLGGGDLNALVALTGFVGGVGVGVITLNKGFSLGRAYKQSSCEGAAFPVLLTSLFVLTAAVPSLFAFSSEGPGSMHAPILISLGCALVAGILAQRSRFCMAGGIRDTMLFKDMHLLWGSLSLLATVLVGNIVLGKFTLGFENQPVAHTEHIWNFIGMIAVGWGSVLLGGCPLRQLIMAGEGDSDSVVTVLGMALGAAICHGFGLASSGAGTTEPGSIAVAAGLVLLGIISVSNIERKHSK